jgi:RimJ/RimL family protein N-acetyltransferase
MAQQDRPTPREEQSDGIVRLRRHRPSDVDGHMEAVGESVPEISPWLPWCHPGYSRAESKAWIAERPAAWESGESFEYVIEDAVTGQFIGGCGLNHLDWPSLRANLGYWLRTSRAGKGIMTRAAGMLAGIGFEDLGLKRIEITAAVDNQASQRVAEKIGAVREGRLRNRFFLHGRTHDAYLYSLIPEDSTNP